MGDYDTHHTKSSNKASFDRLAEIQGPTRIAFKRPRIEKETTEEAPATGNLNSRDPFTSVYGSCPNVSSRYKKISRIGEGTYGIVYKAIDQKTSKYVALKRCLPHHEKTDGFPITTLREIQILKEVSITCSDLNSYREDENIQGSEFIVHLKQVAVGTKPSSVFLVFEYVDFELAKLIDEHFHRYTKSPFSLAEVKTLSIQLLSAIRFIHNRFIIHRDIKLSNLLYDCHRGRLKICDFGLARRTSEEVNQVESHVTSVSSSSSPRDCMTPKVVSLWYRPIELLLGETSYGMAIDCWACGCVIAELLSGQPLFRGRNELDQYQQITELMGMPSIANWPGLQDLIFRRCFQFDVVEVNLSLDRDQVLVMGGNLNASRNASKLLDKFDRLSHQGIELLMNLLRYDPSTRWTASKALDSQFFKESPRAAHEDLMPKFREKL